MSLRIAACTALVCASAPAASVASSSPPRIEADAAVAWCDAMFAPMLTHHRYTGLAVVVVLDGRVLVTKAYGYADAARKTALLPERTRLRIGSITKSMTATIILQLLDEGRIRSLDDPANTYLRRFRLPDYHGKPVTLRHLLTHTAGFEAYLLGLGTEHAAKAPADTAYIRQITPRQVRAPGGQPIYSNFGFEALGAIVEDLTGQTMADVLSQRLFEPLGMDGSALPYALHPSPELGQPYAVFPNSELQPVPYVALHPFASAAGGVEATPMDMARYMIAQLDEDGAAARTILAPRLLREMHTRQAGANSSVPGPGLGVFVADRDGVRIVEHPGHWPGFHNLMTVVPEWKLGLFVSAMAQAPVPSFGEILWGSARLRASAEPAAEPALSLYDLYEIREAFFNRFASARAPMSAAIDARAMVGRYRAAERSHTSPEAVLDFLGSATVVRLARLDAIEVDGNGPYHAIAPDSFARDATASGSPSGLDRYGFVRDAAGSVAYMVDGAGYSVSEPIGALQSPQLWRRYVMAVALLCLSAITLVRGGGIGVVSRIMPWLPLGLLLCLCTQGLVVLAGYDPGRYLVFDVLAGRSVRLAMLVLFGDFIVVLALATVLAAVAAWRVRSWGTSRWGCAARVHFSAIAAAALGLLPLLWSLNLVGVPRILR